MGEIDALTGAYNLASEYFMKKIIMLQIYFSCCMQMYIKENSALFFSWIPFIINE